MLGNIFKIEDCSLFRLRYPLSAYRDKVLSGNCVYRKCFLKVGKFAFISVENSPNNFSVFSILNHYVMDRHAVHLGLLAKNVGGQANALR